ncbi:MAG: hypothetical protein JWR11_2620 [Mycobacterium sp.]|nr:hypothetical protein [Mycobacterium sp.]
MPEDERYAADASEYIGVSVPTLTTWRSRELGPLLWKGPNGRVRYTKNELDRYLVNLKAATMRGGQ